MNDVFPLNASTLLGGTAFAHNDTIKRAIPIERRERLTKDNFERTYLSGGGTPVIVTDAMNEWPATSRWSFDFFRDHFGDDTVEANSPFFLEESVGLTPVRVRLTLRDYINYVQDPTQPPIGEYLLGDWDALHANRIPLYAPAYGLFGLHPELADDVVSSPYFINDLFAKTLPPFVRQFLDRAGNPVHYLFFGPTGSVAYLHSDYWATHAYLAQLMGKKMCLLFSPDDSQNLYRVDPCNALIKNPLTPELSRFPNFASAAPHIGVISPGDMLFIPSGWWHFVVGLEASLTYSYNFFTFHNASAYFTHLFEGLGQVFCGDYQPPAEFLLAAAEMKANARSAFSKMYQV